ncbi:nucleotide disphospho-sugar-binding domain-containing protein [Micromonospora eburnea]|uniref:UDP:flavonoid glycosyltransferase YjiC, YdhE family n=1 Tax=Micromonospora eburnea TaxID=227316 RepID=A0A1C6V0Y9_9ACTN|nr:nucleotide disphospho-sugar-binding domain-containing protein [Micromonospora eburnea]SCL59969.1 UDP:flavonoid glycosyltransferase YjiC, YdhE family [Micromonospora eburnea]
MRVLFTTTPLTGHFFPLVPLAWAFRIAGHDVLVSTSDNFVEPVLRSGLPVAATGPAADLTEIGRAGRPSEPDAVIGRRHTHGRAFARIARQNFAGTRSLVDLWHPHLVVSERAEFAGPLAALAAGVPWVSYHWSVSQLPEYRDAGAEEFSAELSDLGFAGIPAPQRGLNPWPVSLRLPHASDHLGVRHVASSGEAPLPDWAFRTPDRPRICVTLGTVVPRAAGDDASDFMLAMLDHLAALDVELVVAVDDDIAARWHRLPPAVLHAGRIPFGSVLPSCAAIIHHGGQGTALNAVAAGLPQLVLPWFDDQFDNGMTLAESGAGLMLSPPECTPEAVARSCARLLADEKHTDVAATLAREMALLPLPSAVVAHFTDLDAK